MKEELLSRIAERKITVGVVGLGYVGLPLAVEKAKAGFRTIGFDVQEEKVKTICRTARSVAAALYFFSLLLYSVSFTVSVVLILAATGLIYINIPFLPDSAWDDACEFIKRPKEPSKNGNEETDVVPSAASIILQNIMDKYGTAEPEPEPVSVKPETPKKP